MIRRGFTVAELLITITIMGILLTLAVVSLNASQVNARDAERKADAESLAVQLEDYYNSENSNVAYPGGGYYLGHTFLSDANIKSYFPDIDMKATRAPGKSTSDPSSLVAATNTTTTESGVTPQPSVSNDIYVYQPLTASGTLCATPTAGNECRRFNLYYYQESTSSVQKITSKHQ